MSREMAVPVGDGKALRAGPVEYHHNALEVGLYILSPSIKNVVESFDGLLFATVHV